MILNTSDNNWNEVLLVELNKKLNEIIEENTPEHSFREVIKYSLFPTGKLFRPNLILNLAKDLGAVTDEHLTFAAAIEMHHTYTLIHDDLPAMDDDDERRGRPSSHKKFTEYEAILAGDALLALSFGVLGDIKDHGQKILKLMLKYTGAEGLILGQVKDLSHENKDLKDILLIHELKTARLIQLSLTGTAYLCNKPELEEELNKVGKYMGINFQLLDDLCELTEEQSGHELDINPFLSFDGEQIFHIILNYNKELMELFQKYNLGFLRDFYLTYFNKMKTIIQNGKKSVLSQTNLKEEELLKL